MRKNKKVEDWPVSKKKHHCKRCGEEISEEEYEEYDGFCESCYWLEEEELDEEFLF